MLIVVMRVSGWLRLREGAKLMRFRNRLTQICWKRSILEQGFREVGDNMRDGG